ncbi:hypothetical protein CXG81DRAFT_10352 [Caulochytrium protostelioides]|uniref:HECT domain-containing protein n=1 Tax=Caulochytrium protostelioides TaxID=1555241 RepID=A0A4P9XBJ1_9FUNG|nr:hypothetical protein CXG81DRAFT_10352 [Caulochytrium protostelioides]|eukprot:RKP02787.1 hypothetical protein CXG81DRAFT_10352 [Caulochytrium protostelioides]
MIDRGLYDSLQLLVQFAAAGAAARARGASPADIEAITVQDVCIDDLALEFSLPGYGYQIPDASSAAPSPPDADAMPSVTMANLDTYIDGVLDLSVGSGVMHQVAAFRSGFDRVFASSDMRCFSLAEMGLLMGHSDEDWSVPTLLHVIKADHGFTKTSPVIQDLALMMSEYTPSERRAFLQFVTGSPRLPLGGFATLQPPLTVVCKHIEAPAKPDDYLPSVMTCVNYLKVPKYSSREVLRERFSFAVSEGQGAFHLS